MQAATAKAPALSAVGEARGASNQRGVELGKTSIATTGGGGGGGGDGADKKKGAGLAVVVEEDLRPAWCLLPALRGFLKVQGLPEAKRAERKYSEISMRLLSAADPNKAAGTMGGAMEALAAGVGGGEEEEEAGRAARKCSSTCGSTRTFARTV